MNYRNPQTFDRVIETAQELRGDLPRLSFDSQYCLDAPNLLPIGGRTALWWPVQEMVVRGGA